MPKLKLTYFDFDGGRGEAARLAMVIGGVPFEDHRIPGPEWAKHRDSMPFKAMPVLEVDGKVVTQANTILWYVGKLAGLVPKDEWDQTLCSEMLDATEDISSRLGGTIQMPDDQKLAAREKLAAEAIPRHLEQFAKRLEAGGGEWFLEKRLTIADLKVYGWVRWLRAGVLDGIAKDIVDKVAPALAKHAERVATHPKVAAYYAGRKK